MDKQTLRKRIKEKSAFMTDGYIKESSRKIAEQLINSHAFIDSENIFIYMSTKKEPDTSFIINEALKQGKEVYVPKCIDKGNMVPVKISRETEFSEGFMGIMEPLVFDKNFTLQKTDLSVIPCISANLNGERLGHGGGFYDIFLEKTETKKFCLCFHDLLSDNIPTDCNDIKMDAIITERGIFPCNN